MAEGFWTYKLLIDPLTRGLREEISKLIEPGSSVLDIACGPGSLLTELSPGIKSGIGIDLNESKIQLANRLARQKGLSNISFIKADATSLNGMFEKKFDFTILSLALHQFPESLRYKILAEAKKVSKNLIFADYTVPVPSNFSGFLAKMIERIAGEEHYTAYKSYIRLNGLTGILERNAYTVESSSTQGYEVFTIKKISC